MTMMRKLIPVEINQLGDDEIEVIMSTSALARDGHVLEPQGCRLANYKLNPIFLWSHDPDKPIGNSEDIVIEANQIRARVRFAPLGISPKADEVRGLMKAGVIRAVSVGFDPIDGEPLDPRKPKGGQRFTDWELLELSAVSVPSDVGAIVTNRSNGDDTMAESTIETEAATGAGAAKPVKRMDRAVNTRAAISLGARGLYQVANLCYMFEDLGWQVDLAKWEASIEEDGSKVPAMLAAVLSDLGDALLAMTAEEIAEALASRDIEDDPDDELLSVEERTHIRAATTPSVREFRRGFAHAKVRAGKTLSAETVRCLREAKGLHEDAMDLHRSAMRKHKDGIAAIGDMLDRANASSEEAEETDPEETAAAADDTDGQRMSAGFRRRQAEMLALASAD